jgi:hypothetical protein
MKLQFHGHDTIGVAAPILDLHERPLVPCRYVPPDHPDCCMVLKPGQILDLHEIRDRHWLDWMRVNPDFLQVNASPHPDAAMWGRR